ncbi:hypothetical protein [Oceanicola sp. 502str15]|uniref:hypothetical protein n=1 Tax=Oceanicola sp. 502str15 TaxID=2696061 RepID=UPI00209484E8|nr:hypothetical protein [Oceanicola sp. 502str15]MCO6382467.1 hypothetical protein [Oceanicola sp. 502str15]
MRALAFSCAAGLAVPAGALTLEQCNRSVGSLGYEAQRGHDVIGKGLVAHTSENRVNGDDTRWLVVTACTSGRSLSAQSACEEETPGFCDGRKRPLARPDRVKAAMASMVASKKSYSFDQLKAGLARKALRVSDIVQPRETCGCAAAFPEMRNGKKRFKMETGN